jgi:hypothetical protein
MSRLLHALAEGTAMPDDYTKREIIAVAGGVLVLTVLTIWGTIYFLSVVVIGERDDPLARAGGLKPEQTIQSK